jgi:hypothetical protein
LIKHGIPLALAGAVLLIASAGYYRHHESNSLLNREFIPNPMEAIAAPLIQTSLADPVTFQRDVLDARSMRNDRKPKVIINPDGKGGVAGALVGNAGFALYPQGRPPVIIASGLPGIGEDATVGDIDGDGSPDIVIGGLDDHTFALDNPLHTSCPDVYRCAWRVQPIDSQFSSHDVRLADMDHDGALDVVTENAIFFNRDHGRRWLVSNRLHIARDGEGTSTGMLEPDGIADVIAPYHSGTELARFVNPLHTHGDPVRDTWSVRIIDAHPLFTGNMTSAVADFNGDARKDILLAAMYGGGGLVWYEAPKEDNGAWRRHVIDASINFVHQGSLRVQDFDGDGTPDIAFAEQDQSPTQRVGVFDNTKGNGSQWFLQVLSNEGGHNMKAGVIGNDALPSILIARHGFFGGPNPLVLFRFVKASHAKTAASKIAPHQVPGS